MKEIKLVTDTISNYDIDKLIEWLKTYPRLTKGELTKQFEEEYSKWQSCKHSLFVNSGSSANLIMLEALKHHPKYKHIKKIVVPALSWSTDLAPVMQLGYEPILCDINREDLSVDINMFEKICKEQDPDALLLVHVLGYVPNMTKILSICDKYNIALLEDCCEAMGSSFYHTNVGNFGVMSTFSTFFGHHISTIEGGIVCTNDSHLYNILLSLRSHGWTRDLDKSYRDYYRSKWQLNEFNEQYSFIFPGFNLRSTDLQAFIGLLQLEKLNSICLARYENWKTYGEMLEKMDNRDSFLNAHNEIFHKSYFISNFAYPIILNPDTKIKNYELANFLSNVGIESRPLICGSQNKQPVYIEKYGANIKMSCAEILNDYGLYLPNHYDIAEDDINYIIKAIDKFFN